MGIGNEFKENTLSLFYTRMYRRIKEAESAGLLVPSENEKIFSEELRKLSELEGRVRIGFDEIRDPQSRKKGEIAMFACGDIGTGLVVLTELPHRVHVLDYNENYEADESEGDKKRYTKQGYIPRGLYNWLWGFLESNNIWKLKNAGTNSVLGAVSYSINISRGKKVHGFSVYGPHWEKRLSTYSKIVNRISWLSYFAFSKLESIQPYLDEISREEERQWEKL